MILANLSNILAQESSLFHNPVYAQRPMSGAASVPVNAPSNQMISNQVSQPPNVAPGSVGSNPLRGENLNSGVTGQGFVTSNQPFSPQVPPSVQVPSQAGYMAGYTPLSIQSPAFYNYQPPPRQRVLKVHDIVQVRVEEMARMTADGNASARKSGLYDARLQDWVQLDGLSLKPATMSDGQPRARGETNQTLRATSQLTTRESLTLNIAAQIVDIYPNGNIVLEAHKYISNNDNRWRVSLSGICHDSAIGADNVVLSKDIIDLKIDKQEEGQARDGYKRGWFAQWLGRFQPF